MAKTKISALTTLADGSIAIGDLIPIVDIDDTSQAASGTTKKVTITSLASAVATAFSGDSPTFVNLTTTGTTTLGDSGDATTVNGTLGVTGNATFDTNVLFVDAANDRVGIGTVAPTAQLTQIKAGGNFYEGYYSLGNPRMVIAIDGALAYPWIGHNGNQNNASSAVTYINSRTAQRVFFNASGINLQTAPSGTAGDTITWNTGLVVDNTGNATFAGTLGVTGLLTVDANIKFPAAQNASADANTLDDYEEGTWTPVLSGAGTAGTYEISSNIGSYTKIGRQCNISCHITLAATITGGGTAYAVITGLPFAKAANQYPIGAVYFAGVDFLGDYITVGFSTTGSSSTLYFSEVRDNAGSGDLAIAGFAANDIISFSITYFV